MKRMIKRAEIENREWKIDPPPSALNELWRGKEKPFRLRETAL